MSKDNDCNTDVVIIGAGTAGLQCASSLLLESHERLHGLSVRVLEARDRIGGRVWTVTETKQCPSLPSCRSEAEGSSKSFPRDLGAAWVHGTGENGGKYDNPMIELLEDSTQQEQSLLDTQLDPVFVGNAWTRPDTVLHKTGSISLFCNGKQVPDDSPVITEAIRRHYDLQDKVADFSDNLFEAGEGLKTVHLSVDQVRSELMESQRPSLDKEPTQQELEVEALIPFYSFMTDNWNGTSATQLQVNSIEKREGQPKTDETYQPVGDYKGPHCKVESGMETILQPLIRQVEDYVCLSQRVSKVRRTEDGILVETASGESITARCCISTMPLGCLREFANDVFSPNLGDDRVEALDSIATGVYKKVFMTFETISWQPDIPVFGLIRQEERADELGKHLLVYNFWAKHGIPCLEAILCGDPGLWSVHKSDEVIKSAVLKFLEDAMGFAGPRCTDVHITRWEEDSLTLGSYSSYKLGTLERHVGLLSKPEWDGQLLFAGEHTETEHMGSVHAALMSGRRAAGEAFEFLSRKQEDCSKGNSN